MIPGEAGIRVLFVCTANISRSPYAHIRMNEMFSTQVHAASAGIPGTQGRHMDPRMEAELPYESHEANQHRSRRLEREILRGNDLVLTMEFRHHMRILDLWPEASSWTYGLGQFVEALARSTAPGNSPVDRIVQAREDALANSMQWDIPDPYGRGAKAAQRCAHQLDYLVRELGRGLGLSVETAL